MGQSVWLDYISRGLLASGGLARMVNDGWVQGVTSNPTIFQKAVAGSHDYDSTLERLAQRRDAMPYEAFLELAGEDIRAATDVLRPVYDDSRGGDGFVSFEAQAASTETMIAEARRMWLLVERPNLMIKIPGVPEGVAAVEELIAEGVNVNITLLFDVDVYAGFAEAYLLGLERRLAAGQPLNVGSVASFFVSRVDTKVDALLPEGSPLRGRVAVANARRAYHRFESIFSGPRWQRLAEAGARLQRPLWASTGTKNPAYSDVLYVEELVAPHTVNTMPEQTLQAFLDHGRVRPAIAEDNDQSERVLAQAAAAGIDLKQVTAELLQEGLRSFEQDFERLLQEIERQISLMAAQKAPR
jgi:transaldolase